MQMIDDFTAGLDNNSKRIWLRGEIDMNVHMRMHACVWACMFLEMPLFMRLLLQAKHN